MIGFVSAVEIDFDCPDDIFVDVEFECSLEIFDGDGKYDVKIDLDEERDSVLDVWNDGEWKSGYYYLKEFIEDSGEQNVRLKISKKGDYDGILKLRQGGKREFFDIEIEVDGKIEKVEDKMFEEIDFPEKVSTVLFLNNDSVHEDELIYVSKNAKVIDWLPYLFALFLIFVIIILLWERF